MSKATILDQKQLQTMAYKIASALSNITGDEWLSLFDRPNDWRNLFTLICNKKRRLYVEYNATKGMLTVYPVMEANENPGNNSYNFDRVAKENSPNSINCSVTKTEGKIASDIAKRILPISLALVEAAKLDRETEAKRQDFAATETARLVEAIGNAGEYRDGKASGHSPYINLRIGEGYGEINPAFYSSGTASIEIKLRSLDVETAIAVCNVLRQFARATE